MLSLLTQIVKILRFPHDEPRLKPRSPIVGSAKSLIDSIKEAKRSRKTNSKAIGHISNKDIRDAGTSEILGVNPEHYDSDSGSVGDGVDVDVNPLDDQFGPDDVTDYEQSEDESTSSSSSSSESDVTPRKHSGKHARNDSGKVRLKRNNGKQAERDYSSGSESSSTEDEIDKLRNDPKVKKLFRLMMEDDAKKASERKSSGPSRRRETDSESPRYRTPLRAKGNKAVIKSPSDTTIYAPVLVRNVNNDVISIDKFSEIVDQMRKEADQRRSNQGDEQLRDRSRSRSKSRPASSGKKRQRPGDDVVLQAEHFKATIEPPKGTDTSFNLFDQVADYVRTLMSEQDADDEFFHITCHVEPALRRKIERGEFVNLEKLLPVERGNRGNQQEDAGIRIINKNGEQYLAPAERKTRINGVRRWEQAFRVYAAIYSNANPSHSSEIWQYVYVINTAAASYVWENVAYYDYTFRQLMHENPRRNWGKTYNQLWNLALTDAINRPNSYNFSTGKPGSQGQTPTGSNSNSNNSKNHGDWRDNCCWRFNKSGKCNKWNCKYDNRCKFCGGWNHAGLNCYKKNGPKPDKDAPPTSKPETNHQTANRGQKKL